MGSPSNLKQKLLEALNASITEGDLPTDVSLVSTQKKGAGSERPAIELKPADRTLDNGQPVYSVLAQSEDASVSDEPPLPEALQQSSDRLGKVLLQTQQQTEGMRPQKDQKKDFSDTLSRRDVVPDAQTETFHPAGGPSSLAQKRYVKSERVISGGSMADLSGYKDLSKAPMSFGDEDMTMSTLSPDTGFDRGHHHMPVQQHSHMSMPQQHFVQDPANQDVDTEFSGNVKTLIRLVNELPEGVTKQTGAQIIRLTMEAMGISMEDVLSEAQSAQSEMLDAVRANIKKIEEYKTVIRKLETDIKYYQGRANELSEIIDLFILSNTSSQKMPMPDDMSH